MKIIKDKKVYYFNSRFELFNNLYGIDQKDKQENFEKLQKQKNFLKNTYLDIDNGAKYLSLEKVAYGANVKPEIYHAEIWHRVKTLQDYAKSKNFVVPFFFTITPPTQHKPLKQIRLGKTNKYKLIDNKNFDGDLDYVKLAREYISEKWTKFLRQRIFEDIKRLYGERLIYMRTYEPMMDGAPHAHFVAFIPCEFALRFQKLATNYFNETCFDICDVGDNDKKVVGYIMKYILKSFTSAKDGNIDDVGHWYIKNQIRRFTTSRTLIPLNIFRLMRKDEEFQDLHYTNKLYKRGFIDIEIAYNPNKLFDIQHPDLKRKDCYIASVFVYRFDGLDSHFEVLYQKNLNIKMLEKDLDFDDGQQLVKPLHVEKEKEDFYYFSIDGKKDIGIMLECLESQKQNQEIIPVYYQDELRYLIINGKYIPYQVNFKKMRDWQLYTYFQNIDIETVNLHHYHVVRDEMIYRGLLDAISEPCEDINQIIEGINKLHKDKKMIDTITFATTYKKAQ